MGNAPADLQQLKQKMRATWMTGDFGKIAAYSARGAEEFVGRLNIRSGKKVLDVACGTGNLAIPAAKSGADVTGIDIAPNLLAQARERAAAEGLTAQFDEGDAEQLPYATGRFDLVMSMFRAMFAPRPDLVAAELLRVCRPGGRVAMANWTPDGFAGQMFAVTNRHAPPAPGVLSPLLWGQEAVVKERLGPEASGSSVTTSSISTTRRKIELAYPFPPREVVAFYRQYFGPTSTTFARLDPPAQAALAADLEQFWTGLNHADTGRTRVQAEYLEVIAIRK